MRNDFECLADYLSCVASAGDSGPGMWDDRLRPLFAPAAGITASAGSHSGTPSEGGFAIAAQFVDSVWQEIVDTGAVLGMCDVVPMSRETLALPAIDQRSRAEGASRFGGTSMAWTAEGEEITASVPQWSRVELRARKVAGVVHVTDELWADAPALETAFRKLLGLEGAFVIENEIVNGEGTQGPLGVLNSGATLTVAAESGQAAGTFRAENAVSMWNSLWAPSRRNAVWIVNDEIQGQIAVAALGAGSALAKIVDFGPDGSMRLLGRPVLPVEYCPSIGTRGDVILFDPSQYIVGLRSNAFMPSIHLKFLTDESTFRVSFRLDAQPWWKGALTPLNGSGQRSAFVTLAAR